jgi:hypothetical protein
VEILLPLLFLPCFVIFWASVIALISVAGGWYGLSKTYTVPAGLYESGVSYSFQSVRIGLLGNYNSAVTVTVYDRGVKIVPFFIFSILHKPIYFPFSSLTAISFGKFIFPYVSFSIGDKTIRIMGRSVKDIEMKIQNIVKK